jgi:uroporphyrinogen decarboxylase
MTNASPQSPSSPREQREQNVSTALNLFQSALARGNDARPPVWFMRQAGRYHSHYQKLRKQYSFIDLCKLPDVATEVTMGPIEDFDFDAAILFSDLLFPLEVLGMPLEYSPGPKLGWHLQHLADLNRLSPPPLSPVPGGEGQGEGALPQLQFQADALRAIRTRLPGDKGLLGFVGGPLTLFFYAAAGSHHGDLCPAHSGLTDGRYTGFLDKLIPLLAHNMALQWRAGPDCIAVLDTCAGELSPEGFAQHVVPPLRELLAQFHALCPDGKVLYYSKGTDSRHWEKLTDLPIAGIGIDWNTPVADALERFGDRWAIQGNFDPNALLLPESEFLKAAETFFAPVHALPAKLRRGWICGLGHGVLPPTPEKHVHLFLAMQKELFK